MHDTQDEPTLRRARTDDAVAIQKLVNGFASRGLMLPRSLSQVYENVRDYQVMEAGGEIAGVVALHVTWRDLAEVRSLVVAQEQQGRGYARRLVEACLQESSNLGVERVFALTYVPELFEKLGFARTDKALLPRKVWTECMFCTRFHDCTEVAVVWPAQATGAAATAG